MSTAAADAPARVWDPARRPLLIGLVLTITLVAFESLSVITVLPIVAKDLGDLQLYGWVTSAFFLGTLIGLVVAGELTDRHGPAAPFSVGLMIFGVGLLVGATAPRMEVLVAGRFLQGLGGGAVPAVAYAAIGRSFPPQLRPRVFAIMSTAWVLPLDRSGRVLCRRTGIRVAVGVRRIAAVCGDRGGVRDPGAGHPATAGSAGDGSGLDDVVPATRVAVGAALALAGLDVRQWLACRWSRAARSSGWAVARLLPAGTLMLAPGLPAVVAVRGLFTFAFFGTDAFVPLAVTAVRRRSTMVAGFAVTAATMLWTAASWTPGAAVAPLERPPIGHGGTRHHRGRHLAGGLSFRPVPVAVIVVGWAVGGYGSASAISPLTSLDLARGRGWPGRRGERVPDLVRHSRHRAGRGGERRDRGDAVVRRRDGGEATRVGHCRR